MFVQVVKHCAKIGVKTLTLFAFSSENMNRPKEEVGLLFNLFLRVLKNETTETRGITTSGLISLAICLCFHLRNSRALQKKSKEQLQNNTGLNLVIAANYGGQWDIAEAAKKIAAKAVNGEISFWKALTIIVFSVNIQPWHNTLELTY